MLIKECIIEVLYSTGFLMCVLLEVQLSLSEITNQLFVQLFDINPIETFD